MASQYYCGFFKASVSSSPASDSLFAHLQPCYLCMFVADPEGFISSNTVRPNAQCVARCLLSEYQRRINRADDADWRRHLVFLTKRHTSANSHSLVAKRFTSIAQAKAFSKAASLSAPVCTLGLTPLHQQREYLPAASRGESR